MAIEIKNYEVFVEQFKTVSARSAEVARQYGTLQIREWGPFPSGSPDFVTSTISGSDLTNVTSDGALSNLGKLFFEEVLKGVRWLHCRTHNGGDWPFEPDNLIRDMVAGRMTLDDEVRTERMGAACEVVDDRDHRHRDANHHRPGPLVVFARGRSSAG